MVVVFSPFTFDARSKAFWIQRRKLSQDKQLSKLSTQNWIFREATNEIDSDAPSKTWRPYSDLSEGARANIFA